MAPDEPQAAALAWAEYLYDQYMLNKHKQLLLNNTDINIDVYKEGSNE